MSDRTELLETLRMLVGSPLQVDDIGTGWPTVCRVLVEQDEVPVAIYVSRIGLSHRDRDEVERRFQNPADGQALALVADTVPLLVGVWEGDGVAAPRRPVIAVADAARREGRPTRWSVFIPLDVLTAADEHGWSAHINDRGERIVCMRPELLPLEVAARNAGVELDDRVTTESIRATGYFEVAPHGPALGAERSRLRRVVATLVRDARFRGAVLAAYDFRCAMCGLGLGLVQGAHVYPVSAPGSSDSPTNGIALCANHHLAFDRHQIAVVPGEFEIRFRADVLAEAHSDPAARAFVTGTFRQLRLSVTAPVDDNALSLRLKYFTEEYRWLE